MFCRLLAPFIKTWIFYSLGVHQSKLARFVVVACAFYKKNTFYYIVIIIIRACSVKKKRILYWLCALFQKKKMCVLNFFRALLIKTIAFCIACEILRALFRNPNAFCSAYVRFLKNTTGICVGCVHSFENPGVLYQLYAFFLAKNVMFCIAYVRWSGMHLCFLFGACAF